ncbi:cell division protein ZapA [Novosphingobium sp. JCM 18896]|uniref:cell division protein ZapA n=1 Tax=Novosphingobium sp. JCM 18896 TaxID=2989731 RepID=UPI002223D7BD|nr:cell division protein ZapA [Novosphingobium sp. JCM 18896]MCW1431132.1 cell division protein ZapA [Novosphingobium sp. JCM 18896]
MSNVKLEIGGRQFTVACAEGEEDHVTGLGEMIAAKISTMGDVAGQSESRMLLFAALLLADELHDANSRATNSAAPQPGLSQLSAQRLDEIAERLENLASRLES